MTAPGWYPNPADERTINYWTGTEWVGERRWDGQAWVEPASIDEDLLATRSRPLETASPVTADAAPAIAPAPAPAPTPAAPAAAPSPYVPVGTDPAAVPMGAAAPAPATGSGTGTVALPASKTFWLLGGGAAIIAISQFLAHGTLLVDGQKAGTVSLHGVGQFIVVALAAAVGYLAWRHRETPMPTGLRIALTVALGLLGLIFFARIGSLEDAAKEASTSAGGPDLSILGIEPDTLKVTAEWGMGMYAYLAGLVVAAVGVVRCWLGKA